jgi:hypothetical protein
MGRHPEDQGGNAPGLSRVKLWCVAPVDDAAWQMPAEVEDPRPGKSRIELRQARADTGQNGDLGKERV